MLGIQLKHFEKKVIRKVDEDLIIKCGIKVAHPEKMLETILNLCKEYHELEKQFNTKL